MRYQENGWLFQSGNIQNIAREVSEVDLSELFDLADEEDEWITRVKDESQQWEAHPRGGFIDVMLQEIRRQNLSGTTVTYPFGDIVTFPSARHLFRGENKAFKYSVPSLNRTLNKLIPPERELYRVVANMRVEQFSKLLWSFAVVPAWEAEISDVNFKALAQHYGFETHLLDLTNNFRTALFFATCRYDEISDTYFLLTQADIDRDEESGYGVIFHTPNWMLDFMQSQSSLTFFMYLQEHPDLKFPLQLDSGPLDGFAFQIGFQPLHRCHAQSGYLLPMREDKPLQKDQRFEKLCFRQSPQFSQKIYDLMEGGKKVFPYEGIGEVRTALDQIQTGWIFSEDDLEAAYFHWGVNPVQFPTIEHLWEALSKTDIGGKAVKIVSHEVEFPVDRLSLEKINDFYGDVDLAALIGEKIYYRPEQRARRLERRQAIYG